MILEDSTRPHGWEQIKMNRLVYIAVSEFERAAG